MVRTDNDGNVRSFAMTSNEFSKVHRRSNIRFDVLLDIKLLNDQQSQSLQGRNKKSFIMQRKIEEKGILGPCTFRELSYFDVGDGFMADSLHNVYIGAFVRRYCFSIMMVFSLLIILETIVDPLVQSSVSI